MSSLTILAIEDRKDKHLNKITNNKMQFKQWLTIIYSEKIITTNRRHQHQIPNKVRNYSYLLINIDIDWKAFE
jgi:hypothetical protein